MDVIDDLEVEQDRLADLLSRLDDDQWASPSAADGWSVSDVVLHLAQTEEAVVASVSATELPSHWASRTESVDATADSAVRAERAPGREVFARWEAARRTSVTALRSVDPRARVQWVASTVTPPALATTRLSEHWALGLDFTGPLGLPFPDTVRLRDVAWLAHRTLPYAFQVAGQEPREVRCELTSPFGELWTLGPESADSVVRGPAGEFCRVGAQRLRVEDSSLVAEGPHAATALKLMRNYAA
jgi:uncharacterized protein (TIGR03084 family)